MKSKLEMRKLIETQMLTYISEGKSVTKIAKKNKQPKEKVVEIEVNNLPQALKNKYFAE